MTQIDQNSPVQDEIDKVQDEINNIDAPDITVSNDALSAFVPTSAHDAKTPISDAFQADDDEREADKAVIQHTSSTEDEDRKLRAESYKIMASIGNIGIFLLLAVLFTYFIGKWCDDWFGTKPVFTVIWIAIGVAATIKEAVHNIRAASRLGEDKSQTKEVTK